MKRTATPTLDSPSTLAHEETRRAVELYLAAKARQEAAYARKEAACPDPKDARWQKWLELAVFATCDAEKHLIQTIQVWRDDLKSPTALNHIATELRPCALILDGVLYVAAVEDNDESTLSLVVVPMADVVSLDA